TTLRSSAVEWSTAVRWANGSSVVCVAIRSVTATVVSRVEPPAPYVIDTNDGRSDSSSRIACQSCRSASSVLGGEDSNENVGPPANGAPIAAGPPGITEGRPSATGTTLRGVRADPLSGRVREQEERLALHGSSGLVEVGRAADAPDQAGVVD